MADKKLTPKDYDRWGGIVGIKVTGKPNKNTEKDKITYPKQVEYFQNETTEKLSHNTYEYKRKVELVLQKQRNGEELTDDELDILFEQMAEGTADKMTGTHPLKPKTIIEEVEQILTIPSLKETERKIIGKVRIGQGIFRENLISKYKCSCVLCGLCVKDLLVSSHIKEWYESNDTEKIDHENGLLLCVMHDALLDKHLITFDQDGKICISKHMTEQDKILCNINENISIFMSDKTKEYMKFHYNKFIEREKEF